MNILIVEDEHHSARRLARMIKSLQPDAIVHGPLSSIDATVNWLQSNPMPDLVFLDIELDDGDAFTLLDQADICAPVIFCTAFSHYALRAFKA
ncbi:MAG: response regulator, partial [Pseudomonadota bacterium]